GDGPLQDDQKSDPLLDVVYPITFFPGVTDPAAANELHITPGDQEEADVQLVPVPSAHVLVTGLPDSPQGMPYPNIRADDRIFGTSTGMLAPIQRREVSPGTWEIDGLPPGQVALVMQDNTAQGWSERTIATNVSDNSTIDASGAPSGVISGRVILPAGASAGETRVMLVSAREGGVFEASVRKNGTFTFPPLQPGTYRIGTGTDVLNGRSGTRPYIESVSATGAQVTGRTITIFDSGNVDVTVKVGFGRAVVNGIAKLSGKPAPGVMVLLVPTSGQDIALDSRRDQTNSDGSFTLSDVIPGKYILMAISNAWKLDWTDPAALKPYRDKGQAIEITPAQTQSVTVDVQALLAK
ncbi:MAG TPA: carboxypeptidase-like regulatory domain-containing protein, partial [Candidatus Acidoferrum sp.]|nr:carboxypeptidase-like regulatory domain-containing protein [Candidatus Acidoferrum sp.]